MKWEYSGTGLTFLGIGITMVLALPPPWWPAMPKRLVRAGLYCGLALIVFGCAFTFMGIWPDMLRPRLFPILAICAGLTILIGGVVALFESSPTQTTKREQSSSAPHLKLDTSLRDVSVYWPSGSLFPEGKDHKLPPFVLRLKNVTASKALNIQLSFHVDENLDHLRDALKASLFSGLDQMASGEWSIPLRSLHRKNELFNMIVDFRGENVRRIDSLDEKDGNLSVVYPTSIQNIIWMRVLQAGFEAGKRLDEQLKGAPLKSRLELENSLINSFRMRTLILPNVTIDIAYTGLDGKEHQQKEVIRSIFMVLDTPKWVHDDSRKEKDALVFEGGVGDVGFEDKENPDDGGFGVAKRQGIIPSD
jgi:hypothetical protein